MRALLARAASKNYRGIRFNLDFDGTLVSYDRIKSPLYAEPVVRPLAKFFVQCCAALGDVWIVSRRPEDSLESLVPKMGFEVPSDRVIHVS